jgi:hypothetical protein
MTFFMGSVMLLACAEDVRMLVSGGVRGAKPIARHLWRMSFGLFIAAGSFPGAVKPPAPLAFGSGARTTPSPGYFHHDVVFDSHCTPADDADFLASPSAIHKRIPGIDTTRTRES